jgi:hypothetical protein
MTTAACPACGSIWKPTTAEKIAAKSEAPPCFVCSWLRTEEGRRGIAEMSCFEHIPAGASDAAELPGLFSPGPGVSPASKKETA